MVGFGGELAVEAEESLLIWGERLHMRISNRLAEAREKVADERHSCEGAGNTHIDIDFVLHVWVHGDGDCAGFFGAARAGVCNLGREV